MLELRGISKQYRGTVALHPLDLAIPPGQTLVLLGPSGCGKSTLLRIMVGLIRPDTGQVLFQDNPLTPDNAAQFRQRVGFVIQDGGLFPHLTARGNAILMAQNLGWKPEAITTRLKELAELTRFPMNALDRYPAELSGGQRQRVSLMRGLMLNPDLLLFDEPLGALDPLVRRELQEDLRAIFQQLKKTVILVTHDLGEAGFLGDELVLMRAGRIEQQATFAQLLSKPASDFVKQFITAQRPPQGLSGESL
jgi:osmoprotectant transport system ATP-binding protein